jgi:hypothetical protein
MVSTRSFVKFLILSYSALAIAHAGPDINAAQDWLKRQLTGLVNGQTCGIQNNETRCDEGWCCGSNVSTSCLSFRGQANSLERVAVGKVAIIVPGRAVSSSTARLLMQMLYQLAQTHQIYHDQSSEMFLMDQSSPHVLIRVL